MSTAAICLCSKPHSRWSSIGAGRWRCSVCGGAPPDPSPRPDEGARRATAQGLGCDCARLRRTVATLREADDRQRLQIAEQAALIGALQARLGPRPLCGQEGYTTCLATVARGYPSDPEARSALRAISEEVPP